MQKITVQLGYALESYKHVTLDVADLAPETIAKAIDAHVADPDSDSDFRDDYESASSTYVNAIVSGEHSSVYDVPGDAKPLPVPTGYSSLRERLSWALNAGAGDAEDTALRERVMDAYQGDGGPGLRALIREMLAYEAEAFDGDEEVNGGDMVEAFAAWRGRMKALIANDPPLLAPRIRGALETMAGLIDDAISTHIYDDGAGDVIPDDCPYTAAVEEARLILASSDPLTAPAGAIELLGAARGEISELSHQIEQMKGMFRGDTSIQEALDGAEETDQRIGAFLAAVKDDGNPATITVTMDGGLIEEAFPDRRLPGIKVEIVDFDCDGVDVDRLMMVDVGGGKRKPATVYVYDMADARIAPPFAREEATEENMAEA